MTKTGCSPNTANSSSPSKQIGILGGTFDPPHFGHINLALSLLEAHGLQEVWFCPAWVNPLKQGRHTVQAEHRLAMTALAIQDIPCFRLVTWECLQEKVSYTIDLLRHLTAQEELSGQHRSLRLLLGEDAANELHRWKDPDEVVCLAPPLVGRRVNSTLKGAQKPAWEYTDIPLMDISSTMIRHRLQSGLYCRHLISSKVMDYIDDHALYLKVLDRLL